MSGSSKINSTDHLKSRDKAIETGELGEPSKMNSTIETNPYDANNKKESIQSQPSESQMTSATKNDSYSEINKNRDLGNESSEIDSSINNNVDTNECEQIMRESTEMNLNTENSCYAVISGKDDKSSKCLSDMEIMQKPELKSNDKDFECVPNLKNLDGFTEPNQLFSKKAQFDDVPPDSEFVDATADESDDSLGKKLKDSVELEDMPSDSVELENAWKISEQNVTSEEIGEPTGILNNQQESGNLSKLNNLNHEAITKQLEILEEEIENIIDKAVMSYNETKEDNMNYNIETTTEIVESIVSNWTNIFQNKYKIISDLDQEIINSFLLNLIDKITTQNNNNLTSLTEAVNSTLSSKLESLSNPEVCAQILRKTMSQFKESENSLKSHGIKEKEAYEEINKILEINNIDSKKFSDETKLKLLIAYKATEFAEIFSLNDIKTEKLPEEEDIDNVSSRLKAFKGCDRELEMQLIAEYDSLCNKMIVEILEKMESFQNVPKLNELTELSNIIISGLEEFSSDNYDRHSYYKIIIENIYNLLYGKSGKDIDDDVEQIVKDTRQMRDGIALQQWKSFIDRCKNNKEIEIKKKIRSEQEDNCEKTEEIKGPYNKELNEELKPGVKDEEKGEFKQMAKIEGKEEICLEISDFLKEYFKMPNDAYSLDVDELQYHINNKIKYKKFSATEIYNLTDYSNKIKIKFDAAKKSKVKFILAYLLNRGDLIELSKIKDILKERINYREYQRNNLTGMQKTIIQMLEKNCGLLQKHQNENYIELIAINLSKLDILMAKEDYSYSIRTENFKTLKNEVEKISNSKDEMNSKLERIENAIANTLNNFVLSKNVTLSTDIFKYLKDILHSNTKITKEFEREQKTMIYLNIEDLFDDNGRIDHKEWKKASIDNKTVIVQIDGQTQYYSLCESHEFTDLKHNKKNYEILVNEFAKELTIVFKIYKIKSLMNSINKFNTERSLPNLIDVTKCLIYFTSLFEEHEAASNDFETNILVFFDGFYNIIRYIMVTDKVNQTLLSALRVSLDFFVVEMQQQRNLDVNSKLSFLLKSLKSILKYKTYKETNFNLFTEEKEMVRQELLATDDFCDTLNNIITKTIPEIIWLRRFLVPESGAEFFCNLMKLIMKQLPSDLSKIERNNLTLIENYIKDHKNEILLTDLVPDGIKNIDEFVKEINQNKLTWKAILLKTPLTWHVKLQKLYIILCDHWQHINLELIESLLNALFYNKNYENNKKEINSFSKSVLMLYSEKILTKKSLNQNSSECLKKHIENTFIAWEISTLMENKINFLDILIQIKELENNDSDDFDDYKTKLETIQQKFIFYILNIEKEKFEEIDLFSYYYNNESPNGKIGVLRLLTLLPKSCYLNKNGFRNFIIDIIKNGPEILSQELDSLQFYAKEISCLYYDYFLDEILAEMYGENNEITNIKANILDGIQRLYNNNSNGEFLKIVHVWLECETKKVDNQTCNNFFLYESIKNLEQILKFLNVEEKNNLFQLLYFGLNKQFNVSNENAIETEILNEDLDILIIKHHLSHEHLSQEQSVFQSIKQIFNETSINMWLEELIHLRFSLIRKVILRGIKDSDHGNMRLADILNTYRYFQTENSNLTKALNILETLCNNIGKFTYFDEIKDVIFSLIHEKNLENIESIIETSNVRNLTLNILFEQISTKNDKKLANGIQKFKFILSFRKYPEIQDFCNTFLMKIREQQKLNDFSKIIELLIKSKAYLNKEILKKLQENNISLWNSILLKITIYNDFNNTIFSTCRANEKNKIVDLLYQIYDDKGALTQKKLFQKIKNLIKDSRELSNIKRLNKILNQILYKSFDCNNIEKLTTNLVEWENILFENNSCNNDVLSVRELLAAMKDGDKCEAEANGINESVKSYLNENEGLIENLIENSRNLKKKSKICEIISTNISEWTGEDIKQWSKQFMTNYCNNKRIFLWHLSEFNEIFTELIRVIIRGVILYDHHLSGPRDTQLISLFLFLNCPQKGRLGNVFTGEGKTLITVMLATCFGLIGKKVDVVTSSKVLAIRDSKAREHDSKEGYKGFFEMFNLNASNNCDEQCENAAIGENERKKRYSDCSIIYGETSYFQRDILLSKFFKKGIREGSAIGNILILDEVDSMMIDNASKTLYISHEISDLRHLRDIFIHIWAAVHTNEEKNYSPKNVKKIKDYINNIIENSSNCDETIKIAIPRTLNDFVQKNLETWIESAYYAKCMGENDEYIIGDHESQKQNEVIIMDKDTGIEQTSTKWCNGLHQFIQLRHNSKLSDVSLKAVYLSNCGYFQSYENLYGMTGTVGGISERRLLHQVYGIDFFELPRFKNYRFEYDFESEYVASSIEQWLNKIIENIDENMDQQLVYNERDILSMQDKLLKEEKFFKDVEEDFKNILHNKSVLVAKRQEYNNSFEIINTVAKLCKEISNLYETYPIRNIEIRKLSDELRLELINLNDGLRLEQEDTIKFNINEHFDQIFIERIQQFAVDFTNKQKEKIELLESSSKKIEGEIMCFEDLKERTQKDIDFYQKELTNGPGAKRSDSRRAILIICENISDLNLIEDKIRTEFTDSTLYRIYRYDRAYKRFDKSCLEAGDIVIATNIAGRGTDLEVTKQVEENGGLHVLLTYMPKNLRIEKQAFGRTARAGNRGTATFVVFDPRKQIEDIDILQLKNERNDKENVRLNVVQNEQLPKVQLEDELFLKFNNLQREIESKIENKYLLINLKRRNGKDKDRFSLEMDSLKNNWAIWLNKMNDKFEKVHETGRDVILNEYENFEKNIYDKINNEYGLIENPAELSKLGRIYMENEQFSEASKCFNYVIDNHTPFSSIAWYYNSYCLVQTEGGGLDTKLKIKSNLKKSLKMMEEERSKILSRNQILKTINDLARKQGEALLSNCFAKQNEGEAQILSVFINSINSAIGYEVSSYCLNGPNITEEQGKKLFDKLVQKDYNVIKDFRISKKICIGRKILINNICQQKDALDHLGSETNNFKESINFLKNHNSDVLIFSSEIERKNASIINILLNAKIISERNIYKKTINNNFELIRFPDAFHYCKENILDAILLALEDSERERGYHLSRVKNSSSFEDMIYTKEKFMKDTDGIINVEEMIKIPLDIKNKLLGQLNHQVFFNKGDDIKRILTSDLFYVDHAVLIDKIMDIKNTNILFNKQTEIEEFCSGKLKIKIDNKVIELMDKSLMPKDLIIKCIRKICNITEKSNYDDNFELQKLLELMGLNVNVKIVKKDQLISLIYRETNLTKEQILEIFNFLENHSILNVDFKSLEAKFRDVKNKSIFFGKRTDIKNFCLGLSTINLGNNHLIRLCEDKPVAKEEVISALKLIVNYCSEEKCNFEALILHLGFDIGNKYDAIISFKQYSFKNKNSLTEIRKYLDAFNMRDSANNKATIEKFEKLDFYVHSGLLVKSKKIIEILKENLGQDRILKKETFSIDDDEFEILRSLLEDSKIINSSILQYLMPDKIIERENIELNNILMKIYYSGGVMSDQNITFRDNKSGSTELFNRLIELEVIKPPKINFPLGKLKYIPASMENFDITNNVDPVKRVEYIRKKVEESIIEVFQLERKSDWIHQTNEYITGGIGTESENKDLDEKIDIIINALRSVAGSIRVFSEIKIELKNIQDMLNAGNVPPEIIEFNKLFFNQILEYQEYKGFDWDCFLCGMIGVAQIATGVTIEVLSGGALHFVAQTLISEGVGDILYAIEGYIRGNFNWKSYRQHKVQSLMISMITFGIGSYLTRGSQVGQYAVALATKRAIFKAIYKSIILEASTALIDACVSISADEISKVLVDEVVNVQFVQYLEKWTKENNEYHQKIRNIEAQITSIYSKCGISTVSKRIDSCIESTLSELTSGSISDQILGKVFQLMGAINKGLSTASQRLARGSSTAKTLGTVISLVSKIIKASEFIKKLSQFAELCDVCNNFCDHLTGKLSKLNRELNEQIKKGDLVLDEEKIAQEIQSFSISEEVSQHVSEMETKMHMAFKFKIKEAFMKPVIMSALHTSTQPLKKIMLSPFLTAIADLEHHIDERAKEFSEDIRHQDTTRISRLNEKQKKALRWRKQIQNTKNIQDKDYLQSKLANFPNETIESLKRDHGSNFDIMEVDGKIYAVLPTFKEYCEDIMSNKLNVSGDFEFIMAATQEGRTIKIVSSESDGCSELKYHEKGGVYFEPFGESNSSKESFHICYIKGENGQEGHFLPVIKDENGNWKVIRDINQNDNTKKSCFAQSMTFLKEYEKTGNISASRSAAENSDTISTYYERLAKSAMNNRDIQNAYYNGSTVKENRMVGGFQNKPLQGDYPGGIEADFSDETLKFHADIVNEMNQIHKDFLKFNKLPGKKQRRCYNAGSKSLEIKAFGGYNEETKEHYVKEKMMVCSLKAKFTNGDIYEIWTVSGHNKFYVRKKESETSATFTGVDYDFKTKGFKFEDPGKIIDKEIYNIYQNKTIKGVYYSSPCAAQKNLYSLGEYMKENNLELEELKIAESIFKPFSHGAKKKNEINLQESCRHCQTTLPEITREGTKKKNKNKKKIMFV